jgi:hypothetical protein
MRAEEKILMFFLSSYILYTCLFGKYEKKGHRKDGYEKYDP